MLLRVLIWGIITIIVPISGGYAVIAFNTSDTIVPGVSVNETSLGGKTIEEARAVIAQKAAFYEYGKITLAYNEKTWTFAPHDIGIIFDADATARNAYAIGREPNIMRTIMGRARSMISGTTIPFTVDIDEERFAAHTDTAFASLNRTAIDASLRFNDVLHRFEATEARAGTILNKSKLKYDLLNIALHSSERSITLSMQNDDPLITAPMLAHVIVKANVIIDQAPITLILAEPGNPVNTHTPRDVHYQITKEQMKDIITAGYRDNEAYLDANQNEIRAFLAQIAPSINSKPRNAVLTVQNGKAKEFAISRDGMELDIEKSSELIRDGIRAESTRIDLAANVILPEIRTETIENLGLISLLGKGESDFSGSPASRIFNIKLGAEKLNGVLIKPGEEFSFMNTIGDVGAKEGYQSALVIKNGGDLVKEYGGGLCKVSTTMFRAAIDSGLTITERAPHSLPVSYYNPQGFDAAVYSPHPDLRFINNTPSYILVQTRIVGSKLYFEFYGTSDGRETKVIGPIEYDKKPDGSLKAKLTQEIYKDDTLITTKTFTSSYRSPKKEVIQKNPLE